MVTFEEPIEDRRFQYKQLGSKGTFRTLGRPKENQLHVNPSWVEDHDIWMKAKEAAGKKHDEGDPSFYAIVTEIYKKMGGGVRKVKD